MAERAALYRAPTVGHRIEHAGLLLLRAALRVAGRRGGDALGAALGRLAYHFRVRRRVVLRQVRAAFPEKDEGWVRRTARASYLHLGREAVAMIRLSAMDADGIRARTGLKGDTETALRSALAEGRGVVMVTGHLGNWEAAGSGLAVRGIPIDGVAQRQSNPLVDRMLLEARQRLGMRIIERSQASREALRSLRRGRLVAFVADQDARGSGVFVPFMGRPASTHRGPALLALRTGAPLFFGLALRAGDRYALRAKRLEVDRSGDTDEAVARMTAAFTAALEEEVRARPGQYFWHHKRWKTRPPEDADS